MDLKYDFLRKGGPRPSDEQLLDTRLFYRNGREIYARYDEWKGEDRFYFIPLFMQMTYCCCGWTAEMAPDPVWMGSFITCSLTHPELFSFKCPECGAPVYPHHYSGSPLSGRVDLSGGCGCGWKGYESVSGWFIRATALRDQMVADMSRSRRFTLLHPGSSPATVEELLRALGIR